MSILFQVTVEANVGRLPSHVFSVIPFPVPVGVVAKGEGAQWVLFGGAACACAAGEGSGQHALAGTGTPPTARDVAGTVRPRAAGEQHGGNKYQQ